MKITVNLYLTTGDTATIEADGVAARAEVNEALAYFDSIGVLRKESARTDSKATAEVADNGPDPGDEDVKTETPKEAAKPKATRKPKAEPEPQTEPEDGAQTEAPVKAEKAPKVKLEEVTAAITELANTVGLQEARGVLTQFDVKRAAELKPEQYADFIAAAKAASAGGADSVEDVL